jgi:hypothetical protein
MLEIQNTVHLNKQDRGRTNSPFDGASGKWKQSFSSLSTEARRVINKNSVNDSMGSGSQILSRPTPRNPKSSGLSNHTASKATSETESQKMTRPPLASLVNCQTSGQCNTKGILLIPTFAKRVVARAMETEVCRMELYRQRE